MIVPAAIRRRFANLQPEIENLRKQVQATVHGFCNENDGFAYSGRLKTIESLAEKIETGRYAKWSDLDDLFGCCVIIPSLAHEPRAIEFLQQAFVQVEIKKRGDTRKPPDVFRFEATRFIGRLRALVPDETRAAYSTSFEVQIRTAFEHACAVTTHSVYKGKEIDWRARRLAAHLKAAVEQLDLLVLTFESTSETIETREWPDLKVKQKIANLFSGLVAGGKIPEILAPKDWSRFAENLYDLMASGYHGKRFDLHSHVDKSLAALEVEIGKTTHIPHSISLLQLALGILFREKMLALPLEDYCPLVTPEMVQIFTEISGVPNAFLIDD